MHILHISQIQGPIPTQNFNFAMATLEPFFLGHLLMLLSARQGMPKGQAPEENVTILHLLRS
jgi:hypothetical protein